MKNFFIVANSYIEKAQAAKDDIIEYLKVRDASVYVNSYVPTKEEHKYKYTNPELVPAETEAVIVLGGDGTLLQTARDLGDRDIPLIGINFGNLGFLAENDKSRLYDILDNLLADNFTIEKRMMISGKIVRDEKVVYDNVSLNDIVINRSGSLQIINYKISVNNQYLNSYSADGIIVATPTGSTAYSMSAGGPIVNPSASLMLVTPICPHTLNTRSIILGEDDIIEIEILPSRGQAKGNRIAAFDGDNEMYLEDYDKVYVKKAQMYTNIIKMNSLSFLQVLRRKMSGDENSETE